MRFTPKTPDEEELFAFDYRRLLPSGVTISSAAWSATVVTGTDAAPSAMISGAASISGSRVSQLVVGGVDGVTYRLECLATFSDGQVVALSGELRVAENAEA